MKTVAPTVLLLVDEYHFLLAKNKTNILLKDFGPNTYYLIKEPFKKAFHAGTKEDCFVSTLCLMIMNLSSLTLSLHTCMFFVYFVYRNILTKRLQR